MRSAAEAAVVRNAHIAATTRVAMTLRLSSPRRRGPIRRAFAMWPGSGDVDGLVVMGPRLRGDDDGEVLINALRVVVLAAGSMAPPRWAALPPRPVRSR